MLQRVAECVAVCVAACCSVYCVCVAVCYYLVVVDELLFESCFAIAEIESPFPEKLCVNMCVCVCVVCVVCVRESWLAIRILPRNRVKLVFESLNWCSNP